MMGRVSVKDAQPAWVAPHYPEPFIQDRLTLHIRVARALMWLMRRFLANYTYWTRESLR